MGNTKWTTIIEDVWEHMAMKKREMKGHGEPIVPHVVEFQENNGAGLIIQFYDYDGGLVHTYKDPSSDFKLSQAPCYHQRRAQEDDGVDGDRGR